MDADELILQSANAAIGMVGTDKFVKLTEAGLGLVAAEFRKRIKPSDEPGMLLVAHPRHTAKDPIGYMLVLKGRTILAWSVGLRPKSDSVVLPIASAEQMVHTATIPKTWRQPEKLVIDLIGPPTYQVELFNEGNMTGALEVAGGIAAGWATLN